MVEVCKGALTKERPFMVGIEEDSKCFIEKFPFSYIVK